MSEGKEILNEDSSTRNLKKEKFNKRLKSINKYLLGSSEKFLKTKVQSKNILKRNNLEVHIPDRKVENIFHDKSRFFNKELEETKRSMFFE